MVDVEINWINGLSFEGRNSKGNSVIMDVLDSENRMKGIGPMELVLISAGGCTAMDVISILEKSKQKIKNFKVKVSGDRFSEHPKVYKKILIEYIISGDEISYDVVKKAVDLSKDKYCSVSIMLSKSVEIEHKITIQA